MKNNIKYLIALFFVLLILSYFVLQNNQTSSKDESTWLIPELKTQINEVDNIIISKNDKKITLTKNSGVWTVFEANNYLADANIIANLLLDLRKFKLKEMKTAKAENHFRLALNANGEFAGTSVKLSQSKEQFADVIIGKKAPTLQGMYVRKNQETQSWLSEGSLNIKLAPNDWILSTIFDIDINEIKSVTFRSRHEQFTLDKMTPKTKEFELVNLPVNSQLKSGINLSDFANGLSNFKIDSAKAKINLSDKTILEVSFVLFSGMSYHLKISNEDTVYNMNINIENNGQLSDNDRKLSNWTYEIAKYKFEALNKKLSDIIEPNSEGNTSISSSSNDE